MTEGRRFESCRRHHVKARSETWAFVVGESASPATSTGSARREVLAHEVLAHEVLAPSSTNTVLSRGASAPDAAGSGTI
jgi:hypothetical protein